MIRGGATPAGTRGAAERQGARGLPPSGYRTLGATGLTTSVLGFGAYRVDDETPEHRSALEAAVAGGVNLIDTSTNYTDGRSEACIGSLLDRMPREELIVVTKVGYVQGKNLKNALARRAAGHPFPEMVRVTEGCWHCIHPEFLEDQITRSLDRLRLERVDVLLLHNPEYFLSVAPGRGPAPPELRETFYDRIRRAFEHLEGEVRRGRVGWYGVSSNTLVRPPGEGDATSAERFWSAARAVAREPRFAVLQFPLNLLEGGALLVRGEGGKTPLEAARALGLGVLTNRPLNAITPGGLLRLSDPEVQELPVGLEAQAKRVEELEQACPGGAVRWRGEAAAVARQVGGVEHWREVEEGLLRPRWRQAEAEIARSLPGGEGEAFRAWLDRYRPELELLVALLRNAFAEDRQREVRSIHERLDPHLPPALRAEPLARKSLAVAASTPGVTAVLNGMRRPAYVENALRVLRTPPFPVGEGLYRSFAGSGPPDPVV